MAVVPRIFATQPAGNVPASYLDVDFETVITATNVVSLGATGNGSTDDTAAMQDAVDSGDGAVLFMPAGDYKLTDTITITDSGVTLTAPSASSNDLTGGYFKATFADADIFAVDAAAHGVRFDNIAVGVASGTTPTAGAAISAGFSSEGITLTNVRLQNIWDGFVTDGSHTVVVNNLNVETFFGIAIHLDESNHPGSNYKIWQANLFCQTGAFSTPTVGAVGIKLDGASTVQGGSVAITRSEIGFWSTRATGDDDNSTQFIELFAIDSENCTFPVIIEAVGRFKAIAWSHNKALDHCYLLGCDKTLTPNVNMNDATLIECQAINGIKNGFYYAGGVVTLDACIAYGMSASRIVTGTSSGNAGNYSGVYVKSTAADLRIIGGRYGGVGASGTQVPAPSVASIQTGTTTTSLITNSGQTNVNYFKGKTVTVTSGAQAGQTTICTAYDGSGTLTVSPALPGAPVNGDAISINNASQAYAVDIDAANVGRVVIADADLRGNNYGAVRNQSGANTVVVITNCAGADYMSYTWATRPVTAAYLAVGDRIRISDIGPTPGSVYTWNGTAWVPLYPDPTLTYTASIGTTTFTNMPLALTFFPGTVRNANKFDLTQYSQVRLRANIPVNSTVSGAKLSVIYGTGSTLAGIGSWNAIGTSSVEVPADGSNNYNESAWIPLATLAQAEVFVSVAGSGGDGVADPIFGTVTVQFR